MSYRVQDYPDLFDDGASNVKKISPLQQAVEDMKESQPTTRVFDPEEIHDTILINALEAAEAALEKAHASLKCLKIIEPNHRYAVVLKDLDDLVSHIEKLQEARL